VTEEADIPTPDPELRRVGERGHTRKRIVTHGLPAENAEAAAVLIHGRGGSPEGMLTLAGDEPFEGLAWIAPYADGSSWYPRSFLAPIEENEPWLSSALEWVEEIVSDLEEKGIPPERVAFVGFSQGACLASEFVARNPRRYGGVAALSGGVIGPPGSDFEGRFGLDDGHAPGTSGGSSSESGEADDAGGLPEADGGPRDPGASQLGGEPLAGTPVFLGCSDVDPHIPEERVDESARILEILGADVDKRIYPGMGHTVNEEELGRVRQMITDLPQTG